jgi:uncharacterized membrane protein
MGRATDTIIQLIQFAGVTVAFAGVVVAVVRTAGASLAGDRSRRFTEIRLDLARTVLLGLDLLLASAVLEADPATPPRLPAPGAVESPEQ